MKKYYFGILFLLLLSCATAINTMESNKAEDYNFKSDKIFLLVYESDDSSDLIKKITTAISNSLDSVEVENKIHYQKVDELSLNSSFPREVVMEYRPDTILILGLNGGRYYNGDLTDLELIGTLYDPVEDKIVWRTELKSEKSLGFGGISSDAPIKKIGSDFVKGMIKDDLLDANLQNLIFY